MAEAEPGPAGGYVAFISYSHKDAAMGRWLHRKLEGYRLPKRLAGTQGENGEVPARLTPIFRDRDELPAAGDLSERVRAALAVSRNLIVLCSPNSAASPWVAKEIATFRELHPERPIFTAIVEGEPGHCFSPALREGGVEPLAADLRKEGDGRRLGLLELVAGLAGVGLDALVQRDATRRVRRVTYVTAAALAAMLMMAVLTVTAVSARREAQRQRAEAEGLVEFMLTDLRNRLRSVGRLDIMNAVNARALAHYSRHDLADHSTGEILLRAKILNAIGEDEITRGNLPTALTAVREAATLVEKRLSKDPGHAKLRLEHARGQYWLGRIDELRGAWPQALTRYQAFGEGARKLLASAPDDPDFMSEVGWSALDIGNVHLNGLKKPAEAQGYFEEALRWFHRAQRARPDDADLPRVIANAYGWLADSFFARSMWTQSLDARRRQYRLARTLHERDPANSDLTYRYALSQRGLAYSLLKTGARDDAGRYLDDADDTARGLTGYDPRNGDWLMFKAMLGCDLLFADVDLPKDKPAPGLAIEIRDAAAVLTAQRNPRAGDLSRCVAAASRAPTTLH